MTRRGVGACKSINRSHRGNRSLHTLVGTDVSPNRPQPKHASGVGCLLQGCQRSTPAPAAASAVPLACRHGLRAEVEARRPRPPHRRRPEPKTAAVTTVCYFRCPYCQRNCRCYRCYVSIWYLSCSSLFLWLSFALLANRYQRDEPLEYPRVPSSTPRE
jgi:hypothetical protein